ncbi:MAG: hypothetical protein IJK01_08570 [Clostridia bacterium]|nr:hypothetical protein [Clostridia bacterium]
MKVKVEADLPFTFCAECVRRELNDGPIYLGDNIARLDTRCKRAGICKNAIELYQQRLDDGRPVYPEESEGKDDHR